VTAGTGDGMCKVTGRGIRVSNIPRRTAFLVSFSLGSALAQGLPARLLERLAMVISAADAAWV